MDFVRKVQVFHCSYLSDTVTFGPSVWNCERVWEKLSEEVKKKKKKAVRGENAAFLTENSWKSHFLIARTHSKKGSIQPPVFSHLQNVRYECCISIKEMPYIFFQPPSDYMGKMTQRRFIKNVESQKKGGLIKKEVFRKPKFVHTVSSQKRTNPV